jgi:hypothetical protein
VSLKRILLLKASQLVEKVSIPWRELLLFLTSDILGAAELNISFFVCGAKVGAPTSQSTSESELPQDREKGVSD